MTLIQGRSDCAQVRFEGYASVVAEGRGFQHRHEYIPVACGGDVLSPTLLETPALDLKVSPKCPTCE